MNASFSRDETVQRLKAMADIVQIIGEHVQLRRSGTNYQGLCPFHSEKTPSFMVNPARRCFHCFGCGEGGDVFTFLMLYHRLTFPEVLKDLATRYQLELPQVQLSVQDKEKLQRRQALYEINDKATALYHRFLLTSPQAEPARRYLKGRAIPDELVARFRLGFSPERWDFLLKDLARSFTPALLREAGLVVEKEQGGFYDRFRSRILFPISELTGRPVAFSGRVLGEGQPKYLNSPETSIFSKSHTLFGLAQNREEIRRSGTCLLVEGNFDMLSLVAHSVPNVVAPLGTALTASQIRILKGYADNAVLLFDGDAAGLKAAMRLVPLFLSEQLAARVVILPAGHDPDSFIRSQGREGLEKLIAKALPLSDFVFTRLADNYGLGLEGKGKIIAELQPLLAASPDRVQQLLFASHFAQKLGIAPEEFLGGVRQHRSAAALPPKGAIILDLPLKQKQLLEFLICHPEYLEDFMDEGINEVLASTAGRNILQQLQLLAGDGSEGLLESLEPGPERTFVARLLLSSPSYTDVEIEEIASGMREWLKRTNFKNKKEQLIRQMNLAFQAQDEHLCLELQEKIREVDRIISN
jgi:DNA primase